MFEPLMDEETVHVAIASSEVVHCLKTYGEVAIDDLTAQYITEKTLDLLLVGSVSETQIRKIRPWCESSCCDVVFVDSLSKDDKVVNNVMRNIAKKLTVRQMPNNIDISDIRKISNQSSHVLAFNSYQELYHFLDTQKLHNLNGLIYLAHGGDLSNYEANNRHLRDFISPQTYFISSFLSGGLGECTVLVSITYSD
ncbi:hypothetical protein AB0537_003760 [Vibrio parahaemolyticus]|uniref:hypothetical protein n=1 Tax=Vibrio parahaemolyticus TaxID=670 RepID=UPI002269AAA9|nr:hypothetical protein [Vibrio parahaemolyticus]EJC7036891.1 hypothetical protein [Vibrio parahaemolyticus]MBE5173352.1 hypothetical protein [Vibrio parahaemolyticus]MCX8777944.1 hypothetical protein [Vibrio parahaemolyticus]